MNLCRISLILITNIIMIITFWWNIDWKCVNYITIVHSTSIYVCNYYMLFEFNITFTLLSRSSNQKLTGTIYQYGPDSDSSFVDIDLTPLSTLSLRVPPLDNLSFVSVWLQGRKISHPFYSALKSSDHSAYWYYLPIWLWFGCSLEDTNMALCQLSPWEFHPWIICLLVFVVFQPRGYTTYCGIILFTIIDCSLYVNK